MDCKGVKGKNIKVKTKLITEPRHPGIIENQIPKNKKIISIQIQPNSISYGSVDDWLLVITYKDTSGSGEQSII